MNVYRVTIGLETIQFEAKTVAQAIKICRRMKDSMKETSFVLICLF